MEKFEDKLHRELKKRYLSATQMEFDTNISHTIFTPHIKGIRQHRLSTLMALAYYLGTTVEDLVAGTDLEGVYEDVPVHKEGEFA